MHAHFLDPYRHGISPVHRLDARVKLVLAVAFILTAALAPSGVWPVYVLLLAVSLSVVIASELGLAYVLKRALLALPFVLAAAPMLFTTPGWPLLNETIGPLTIRITETGLARFLSVALKSWLSVQVAIVLAATTSFHDLLAAMRSLRLPKLLVAVIGLMWRYLFVLVDEVLRLMRAREARSGFMPHSGLRRGGSLAWRGRVAGGMAGNLFLRSFDRAERIYAAMAARGYDGEVRGLPRPPVSGGAWAVLLLGLAVLLATLLVGSLL